MNDAGTTKLDVDVFAQTLRRSHCSAGDDKGHDCVGTCTITPKGIELACKLCGKDDHPIIARPLQWKNAIARATRILDVAGLDYRVLSPDTQLRLLKELLRDHCPGCNANHTLDEDYVRCKCGEWQRDRGAGWRKTTHLSLPRHTPPPVTPPSVGYIDDPANAPPSTPEPPPATPPDDAPDIPF